MTSFIQFPKIPRLFRDMVLTEKIDGTNASIKIVDNIGSENPPAEFMVACASPTGPFMYVGSRTRWITPEKNKDNYGFAAWVRDHANDLFTLGPGHHFGEWWGQGIQDGYGLSEKRFSLFNVGKWTDENTPSCVHVVPKLYEGPFDIDVINQWIKELALNGSHAAPGWMKPEGIIVFHAASSQLFKVTLENDATPKSLA